MTISDKSFLKNIGLTQSLILAYQSCLRKFVLKANGYSVKSKRDKFLFGSLVHEALDLLYSNKYTNFSDFEIYFTNKKMKEFLLVDTQQVELDFALCGIMISEYCKRYTDDFSKKKFDGVEEEFEVSHNIATLRGKKDGCFYIDKKRWLMEHKTKSRFNEESLMLQLSHDFQNLFYILADELMHGEKIAGVLYNVIRKPQLKIKRTETIKEFCDRVLEDVKKRPEWYFIRWEIPYTKKDKQRFIVELNQKMQAIDTAIQTNSFYKCENSCASQYTCDFLPACAANSLIGLEKNDNIFPELNNVKVRI